MTGGSGRAAGQESTGPVRARRSGNGWFLTCSQAGANERGGRCPRQGVHQWAACIDKGGRYQANGGTRLAKGAATAGVSRRRAWACIALRCVRTARPHGHFVAVHRWLCGSACLSLAHALHRHLYRHSVSGPSPPRGEDQQNNDKQSAKHGANDRREC